MEGKEKPPHYDLKAATKVIMTKTQELIVIQRLREWPATNPDGKLPTNQKIER